MMMTLRPRERERIFLQQTQEIKFRVVIPPAASITCSFHNFSDICANLSATESVRPKMPFRGSLISTPNSRRRTSSTLRQSAAHEFKTETEKYFPNSKVLRLEKCKK